MSSNFESILNELHALETDLKTTATHLWKIKFSLLSASLDGHKDDDFYPRRLKSIRAKKEVQFETLLNRLQGLVSRRLDRALFIFSSRSDVVALTHINRKIKSLHNAFARELGIGPTWARLNSLLPVQARLSR